MTLPHERYRALVWAKAFLLHLIDPSKTPKVPGYIREQAMSVLKHFPYDYHIEEIAEKVPKYFKNNDS